MIITIVWQEFIKFILLEQRYFARACAQIKRVQKEKLSIFLYLSISIYLQNCIILLRCNGKRGFQTFFFESQNHSFKNTYKLSKEQSESQWHIKVTTVQRTLESLKGSTFLTQCFEAETVFWDGNNLNFLFCIQ